MPDRFSRSAKGGFADAMEGNLCNGREDGLHRRVSARGAADDGAVRVLWHQPRHRLPVAGPLSGSGAWWVGAALAGAAPARDGDARGGCQGDHVAAAPAAVLGSQEAARGVAAARSETALAGGLDNWRSAAAPRAERGAPPSTASGAGDPALSAGARAKRSVVH